MVKNISEKTPNLNKLIIQGGRLYRQVSAVDYTGYSGSDFECAKKIDSRYTQVYDVCVTY